VRCERSSREPSYEQILEFCSRAPVERVFLEDIARRGLGRFVGVERGDGMLESLCLLGANLVPSGSGCAAFAGHAALSGSRLIIGSEAAVSELWARPSHCSRPARGQAPPAGLRDPHTAVVGASGLRPAVLADLERLVTVCAEAHAVELGVDPLRQDAEGFRWRTQMQIVEGRSWLWLEDDVVWFKAEVSAWTPAAVQVQQVWSTRLLAVRATVRAGCATSAACSWHARLPSPSLSGARTRRRSRSTNRWDGTRRPLPLDPLLTVELVYLARHGESVYSAQSLLNGDPSVPCGLTPRGFEQARELGRQLLGHRLDLCITTAFERTQITAARRSPDEGSTA